MSRPDKHRYLLPLAAVWLLSCGCGEPPAISQYVIDSETDPHFTSELLRRDFPPVPFRWEIPKSWSPTSNDEFSLRAWNAGPPAASAGITIGRFPARSGIPSQVHRWRRQVGLERKSDDEAMKAVESLKTKNGAGSFAAIEGPTESIFAFILPVKSHFWIFRFRARNDTAGVEADGFRSFCESLEYVASADPPTLGSVQSIPPSPHGITDSPPADTTSPPSEAATPDPEPAAADDDSESSTEDQNTDQTETEPSEDLPPSGSDDADAAEEASAEGEE